MTFQITSNYCTDTELEKYYLVSRAISNIPAFYCSAETVRSFEINTDFLIEKSEFSDDELTIHSYEIVEQSLMEVWKDEDDDHWESFLNE